VEGARAALAEMDELARLKAAHAKLGKWKEEYILLACHTINRINVYTKK
jgi:hypothetical protein